MKTHTNDIEKRPGDGFLKPFSFISISKSAVNHFSYFVVFVIPPFKMLEYIILYKCEI